MKKADKEKLKTIIVFILGPLIYGLLKLYVKDFPFTSDEVVGFLLTLVGWLIGGWRIYRVKSNKYKLF